MMKKNNQRGIAAVGTIIAVIAAMSIAAASGTYMALRQKERLSDNDLIIKLKNQADAFRNEVIQRAAKINDTDMEIIYSGAAGWSWPIVDSKRYSYGYSYDNVALGEDADAGGGGGGRLEAEEEGAGESVTYIYTTTAGHTSVLAHYAEDPLRRSRELETGDVTDVEIMAPHARYSDSMSVDMKETFVDGISAWAYRNNADGVYIYLDAPKNLSDESLNQYYEKEILARLAKAIGEDETTLCVTDDYHRVIAWIRKLASSTTNVCNF